MCCRFPVIPTCGHFEQKGEAIPALPVKRRLGNFIIALKKWGGNCREESGLFETQMQKRGSDPLGSDPRSVTAWSLFDLFHHPHTCGIGDGQGKDDGAGLGAGTGLVYDGTHDVVLLAFANDDKDHFLFCC